MDLKDYQYIQVFLPVLFECVTKGGAADLCPYDSDDEPFSRNTKFRFCSSGCCGRFGHDVCCHDIRTEIIIGCVVGGIILLTVVVVAACCYYARYARPRRVQRLGRATIMVPSTVFHTSTRNAPMVEVIRSPQASFMQGPPSYDVVIEQSQSHDKPPSYDDVIRGDSTTTPKPNLTAYG